MTRDEAREAAVRYWIDSAGAALAARLQIEPIEKHVAGIHMQLPCLRRWADGRYGHVTQKD